MDNTKAGWRECADAGLWVVETQEKALTAALRSAGEQVAVRRLTPLPSADVLFTVSGQLVGVERKAASDLVTSWVGALQKCVEDCEDCGGKGCPHLGSQLQRMRRNVDHVVLVIEGWLGKNERGYIETATHKHRVLWDGLWNTLSKWQGRGVEIQMTLDIQHTAKRLISLRAYLTRRGKLS